MPGAVFDLRGQVSADVSPFNSAMDASAHSVSRSLQAMQVAASTFMGSGVIRTFIKATDAATKFGQTLADISAIADYNLKSLRSSIIGLDNVYGRASKVGETMYEIISSGVRGSEKDLVEFTKVAKQTAVSIKADLYDTANVLTTLTNAYGLSVKDVQKLSDMLFVTVREGKAHGNELARTLGLVTNTAAEAGVSLAEMAATISVLSRTQSASQSMIGFNQLLNSIIKPTQEATREAQYWGIELNATALKTKGLTGVLEEMHQKTGGNVRAINAMLGNIRAMRAGVSLTGRQFENFINILKTAENEIGSGAAFEAFKKQTDTTAQAIENLRTQIDKTYITIGKDLEPVTKTLATGFESVLKSFSDENNTLGRWSMYLSAGSLTLSGIIKAISGIKSLTSAINNHTKALTSSSNTVAVRTKGISDNLARATANAKALNRELNRASMPIMPQYRGTGRMMSRYATLESTYPEWTIQEAKRSVANQYSRNKAGGLIDPVAHRRVSEPIVMETALKAANQRHIALLERYNRRYGTHLKELPTSDAMRRFTASFQRVPVVLGELTTGLSKILGTFGIWMFAASAVGSFAKALIEKASEKEVQAITEATDKRMLTGYRQAAYNRLSIAYNNKKLTDAEYRLYDSSIRLATSQEQLSKVIQDIANNERKKTKKSLADEYAEAEKAHADRVKQIEENYKKQASAITGQQSEDLKAYIRDNALSANAEYFTAPQNVEKNLKKLGDLAPEIEYGYRFDPTTGEAIENNVARLKGTEAIDKAIMDAFSQENWRDAVTALRDKFVSALRDGTIIEQDFAIRMVERINEMTDIREKNADADKFRSEAIKASTLTELGVKADALNKRAEDAIYDEMYTVQAQAATRTLDRRGASAAYNTIDKRLEIKNKAESEVKRQTAELKRLENEYLKKGLTTDEIKAQLKGNYDRLNVMKTQANTAIENLYNVFSDHVAAIDKAIDEASYTKSGMRLRPRSMTIKLAKMLKDQYRLFNTADNDAKRQTAMSGIYHIRAKLDSAMSDYAEHYSNRMQLRKEAGLATESQTLQAAVLTQRNILNMERRNLNNAPIYARGMQQQRLTDASLKLRAALLKLSQTTLDTSTSLRNGLMGQVQKFAEQRDSKGRMSNDALYHSISLMSRLGGGTAIQTSKGMSMSVGNGRAVSFKTAQEAQTAVSRSLDSYIMSQQYAEASKGRAVVDIYNLLKQNIGKGITVN